MLVQKFTSCCIKDNKVILKGVMNSGEEFIIQADLLSEFSPTINMNSSNLNSKEITLDFDLSLNGFEMFIIPYLKVKKGKRAYTKKHYKYNKKTTRK